LKREKGKGSGYPLPSLAQLTSRLDKAVEVRKAVKRQLERQEALSGFRDTLADRVGVAAAEGYAKLAARRNRLFLDPSLLRPISDPPNMRVAVRRQSMRALRSLILESIRSQTASCVFIFGKPGTGKTLCVRAALSELNKFLRREKIAGHVVYVNAGQTRSPYYTMLEILREMGVDAPPSGWQFSRLKYEFERVKDKKPTIIAVDEVDTLLYKEREPLIYYLNRQPYISLILISNQFSDLTNLPPRAKSSLQPIPIIFHPYTAEDVYVILKERVKHAFRSGVVEEEVLHAAAEEIGDIRFGFNLLLLAGLAAEASAKTAVRMEDLEAFTSGLKEVFAGS